MRHRERRPMTAAFVGAVSGVLIVVGMLAVWLVVDLFVGAGLLRELMAGAAVAGLLVGYWLERWGK